MILDLPKSYLCVTACSGDPNRYLMHGVHIDKHGLTCTDGKTLAHLQWNGDEIPRALPEEGLTVSIATGVRIDGTRAKVELKNLAEGGRFAPYRNVMPDLGKDYLPWQGSLGALERLARLLRGFDKDADALVEIHEEGFKAQFQGPEIGRGTYEHDPQGGVLIKKTGFRGSTLGRALSAWRGAGIRETNVFWGKADGRLVITGGRLLVLCMSLDLP